MGGGSMAAAPAPYNPPAPYYPPAPSLSSGDDETARRGVRDNTKRIEQEAADIADLRAKILNIHAQKGAPGDAGRECTSKPESGKAT